MKYSRLLVLPFLFISFFTKASHDVGGEIYFECLGNNQFKFVAKLYRDCVNNPAQLGTFRSIYTVTDTFRLNLDSVKDMTYQCVGPGGGGCGTNTFSGGSSMSVFSDTITLTSPPPATGLEFYMTGCCRPQGTVNTPEFSNWRYRCIMYPAAYYQCVSSPRFLYNPSHRITKNNRSISALVHADPHHDSLHYDFENFLAYNPGFSYSQPFPNPSTSTGNLPVTINHQNGLIEFKSNTGANGWYVYEVGIEQWRNGILLSKPVRSFHVYGDWNNTHSTPSVTIDTSLSNLSQQGRIYKAIVYTGDTLAFDLIAKNSFNFIDFRAWGSALSTQWFQSSPYVKRASISPKLPQTSFVQQDSSAMNFNWPIDNEHTGSKPVKHDILLQFRNLGCPSSGVTNLHLEVEVRRGTFIEEDTLQLCQGDSIQLNGFTRSNLQYWTNSDTTFTSFQINPYVAPGNSVMYYLTDPSFPGISDSVFVDVTPKDSFALKLAGTTLVLSDSNYTSNRTWYYNNISFSYPFDTLQAFAYGDYYVAAQKGNCRYISDTVTVASGLFTTFFNPPNGSFNGNQFPVTGSMGITFQVTKGQNVLSTNIPGIQDLHGKTGGYDLNIKLYDSSGTEIFNTDTVLSKPLDGLISLKTPFQLKPYRDYTLSITGDTGYVFSLIDSLSYPFNPYSTDITVVSANEGTARSFPYNSSQYLIPMCLTYGKDVGIEEFNDIEVSLYPNPANNKITITGISNALYITLMDVSGKEVFSARPDSQQDSFIISRNELPTGMYFLKVKYETKEIVRKVIWN